jgi:hypothetical protein
MGQKEMSVDKSEKQLLDEISKKMDTLIGVVATQGKEINEKINVLRDLGWSWEQIGIMVRLKPDAARKRYKK